MVETIEVLATTPVRGPDAVVYSTGPRKAYDADARTYYVKGFQRQDIAFAELAGCLLAQLVGLAVPKAFVARLEGEPLCGTEEVADIGRSIGLPLRPDYQVNFSELYAAVVVDVWLANCDRNRGNVLTRQSKNGPELVMIDFERSRSLLEHPIVGCPMIEPQQCWPREELGQLASLHRPIAPPPGMIASIKGFTGDATRLGEVLTAVAAHFPGVTWAEGSAFVLRQRGQQIDELAREAWLQ